jgi:hypothetical protein
MCYISVSLSLYVLSILSSLDYNLSWKNQSSRFDTEYEQNQLINVNKLKDTVNETQCFLKHC